MTTDERDFASLTVDEFFVDLPESSSAAPEKWRPLLEIIRQHHVDNPFLEYEEGWALVYDQREAMRNSVPIDMAVEGREPRQRVVERVHDTCKRIKRAAAKHPELGEFEIRRRQGAVYVKHIGDVPT